MYDISDFDIQDARQGYNEEEFEDPESLRTLKVLAARFYTARKMLLCGMLALDASGESSDLLRWTAAVEALQALNKVTKGAYKNIQDILGEEQCKISQRRFTATMPANSFSISRSTDAQGPANAGPRTLASTITKARISVNWYSWLAGQAAPPTRGIRQGSR